MLSIANTDRCAALLGALLFGVLFVTPAAAAPGLSKQIDPTERSFSIDLPQGWNNALGLNRTQGNFKLPRSWATSASPDGSTQWFMGDPNVPLFQTHIPQQMIQASGLPPQQAQQFMSNFLRQEGVAIRPYQTAERFASDYAQRRFGRQPGFRIVDSKPNPALAKAIADLSKRLGDPVRQIETVTTRFEFTGHSGEIWIASGRSPDDPNMWSADVSGFTTTQSHGPQAELFARSALSMDISPKWMAREKQQAQQRQNQFAQQMQQNQARQSQMQNQGHQQRMAALKNNFNRHQAKMAGRSAAMDQQNQMWQNSQNQSSQQHQAWMNNQNQSYQQHQSYIRGVQDRTLVNTNGDYGNTSYEVDAGANNYYVDPLNNQYFGTDAPLDQGQIPDGYQQADESSGSW